MAYTLSKNCLNVGSKGGARVSWEGIVRNIGCRGLRDAKYVGPLFDILPEVLWIECGIASRDVLDSVSEQEYERLTQCHARTGTWGVCH